MEPHGYILIYKSLVSSYKQKSHVNEDFRGLYAQLERSYFINSSSDEILILADQTKEDDDGEDKTYRSRKRSNALDDEAFMAAMVKNSRARQSAKEGHRNVSHY